MRFPFGWTRHTHAALALSTCLAAGVAALLPVSAHAAAPASTPGGIAWQVAASDAEVDKAFELARKSGKPVFLYWGAVWCPPCNQVKATLFNRPDFIERTRAFVPVYVDGDRPGAQKVASRFKVAGYPTMVLFKPDGTELTRLPGEVDPERYLLTMTAGLNAEVPVSELARRALAHQSLSAEQWRLLSFYSWDTDQQQVVKDQPLASTLQALSVAVPAEFPAVRDRLAFKALQARAGDDKAGVQATDAERALAERLLSDKASVLALPDLVIYGGPAVVKLLGSTPQSRASWASRWDAALVSLVASGKLSRTERVDALDARVELWNWIDGTSASTPARQQAVAQEVSQLVTQTTDRYERQSVVPSAAHVLTAAGLVAESDALIKAELPRAVAPYYHMLVLASNARARGDKAGALQWYQEAWRKSEGPATRLQWGTGYIKHLVELSPQDVRRIAAATDAVLSELQPVGETFHERNERSLQRLARTLAEWQGKDPVRQKVFADARQRLQRTCGHLKPGDTGRANCDRVFASAQGAVQRPA